MSNTPSSSSESSSSSCSSQCSSQTVPLTSSQLKHALEHQLSSEWYLQDQQLHRDWMIGASTDSGGKKLNPFVSAVTFIQQLSQLAEQQQHHPDIHLTQYQHIRVSIYTHAISNISEHDIQLAQAIDALPAPPLSKKHQTRQQLKEQDNNKPADESSPILLDFPSQILTPRLLLRPYKSCGDGRMVNEAVHDSLAELQPWMPWCNPPPTIEQSELMTRKSCSEWIARTNFPVPMLDRATGQMIGAAGLHRIKWQNDVVACDVGYWLRAGYAGRGYATEAANAMARFADKYFRLANKALRIEIICYETNSKSKAVAKRLNFELEKILPLCPFNHNPDPTCIYVANVDRLPPLAVKFVHEQ